MSAAGRLRVGIVPGIAVNVDNVRVDALGQDLADAIAQELEVDTVGGLEVRRRLPPEGIPLDCVTNPICVKDVAKPEEIRAEELILKRFGLVPPDFELAKTTVDLLTEQAAAFYDYEKKKLFITDSTPSETQKPVLAHELSHALADQNFNLGKFIRQGRKSDDGSTARLAVMEGQATWLMTEYLAHKAGGSLRNSPELAVAMSGLSESAGGQFPVFESSPLYLRRSLIFPYTKGMLFQGAVIDRDGNAAFGEVFRKPPVSTQQIAHPEKYFASVIPSNPALPQANLPGGYKSLVGGSLGELEHTILIEQYTGKQAAEEIAPHWRGCAFEFRENRKQKRVVLFYSVEWDSEESARRYFAFYRDALGRNGKRLQLRPNPPTFSAGQATKAGLNCGAPARS
jgi:hypothetical protein